MKRTSSVLVGLAAFCAFTASAATGAYILLTPVLLPAVGSPSLSAAQSEVISNALAGVSPTNRSVSVPTDYAVCDYGISWSNLVESSTTDMWAGTIDPAPPFQDEFGQVPWILVDVRAASTNDAVSLDQVSVDTDSDDGHLLASSASLSGLSYSPLAPLVLQDGTIVTNGPDSQQGQRCLILVLGTMFQGNTQAQLDDVKAWINSHGPYDYTWTVQYGSSSIQSSAAVTTGSAPTAPILMMSPSAGNVGLSVSNAVPTLTYSVYSASQANGPWSFYGTFNGTNTLSAPEIQAQQFFRVSVE